MGELRIGSVPYLNAKPLIEGLGDIVLDVAAGANLVVAQARFPVAPLAAGDPRMELEAKDRRRLAMDVLKSAQAGLAPAIFGPWMNASGSVLASYWRRRPVDPGDVSAEPSA